MAKFLSYLSEAERKKELRKYWMKQSKKKKDAWRKKHKKELVKKVKEKWWIAKVGFYDPNWIKKQKQIKHQKSIKRKKEREKFYKESGLKAKWDKSPKRLLQKREYNKRPEVRVRIKEYKKQYYKLHPEKRIKSKGISKEAFEKIKKKYDYKCAICDKREPFLNQYWHYLTQDHIVPKSKGGRKRSKINIQPVCWNCNIKKGNKMAISKNERKN